MKNKLCVLLLVLLLGACKGDSLPKPKAMLRLDFPEGQYAAYNDNCAFGFLKNSQAVIKKQDGCSLELDYPAMKGSIYLTYKKVSGNLRALLLDAEKLTYEHVVKADGIAPKEYLNDDKKVYGMFFEVSGNAASQSQFYVTDSTDHFVTGSLYFYAKPNYDSIYPAAKYLQRDIRQIMETLSWK